MNKNLRFKLYVISGKFAYRLIIKNSSSYFCDTHTIALFALKKKTL